MKRMNIIIWIALCIDAVHSSVSYNMPQFCPNATWNDTAVTFLERTTTSDKLIGLFVDINNTVYLGDESHNRVLVWLNGNATSVRTLSSGLSEPRGIFATTNGDIYVDNGKNNGNVLKWTLSATNGVSIMSVPEQCDGLFIDLVNTLYCSTGNDDKVYKKSLLIGGTSSSVAAGTGSSGSNANQLDNPKGIYVDFAFNLYVADSNNDRIQLFTPLSPNAITVAGATAPGTITLNNPRDIVLDADGYMYIVDTDNDRIVASGRYGFRCLIGCSGQSGSQSNQLNQPQSLSFDSYGNLFVADTDNSRIQKVIFLTDSCVAAQTTNKIYTTAAKTTLVAEETTSIKPVFSSLLTTTSQTSTAAALSTQSQSTSALPATSTEKLMTTTMSTLSSTIATTKHDMTTTVHSTASDNTTEIPKISTSSIAGSTFSSLISTTTIAVHSTPNYHTATMKSTVIAETTTVMIKNSHPTTSIVAIPSASDFFLPTCSSTSQIGLTCNMSNTPCASLNPCQNAATCINNNTTLNGYVCYCSSDFNGTDCEIDIRPCKPNTCWHNGTCINVSNSDSVCTCNEGWTGIHCETMINYCKNITCQNNGVCRPLFQDYKCECLGSSYSGRHCEISASTLAVRQIVSKSFGYIAIIFIISVFVLVATLDIMKYIFGINSTGVYRKSLKRKHLRRQKKQTPMPVRYIYVNYMTASSTTQSFTV